MQYYVVLKDYGPHYPGKKGPSGFEAIVHPEDTRRQIIEEVRDTLSEESRCELVHVKHIDGNECEDVTVEIIDCAKGLDSNDWHERSKARMQAAKIDRARDLRKHAQAAE